MLNVTNLSAKLEDGKEILFSIDLDVNSGEIHLIMGKNGAGKSSLGKVIAGISEYITAGSVKYEGEELLGKEPDYIARKGVLLAYQSPVEVPGVRMIEFLRIAYNKLHPANQLDPWEFKELFDAVASSLGLSEEFSERNLNEGFSGGEKKKSEILQMLLLEPKLAILDEVDSGLDIDSLSVIFNEIRLFVNETDSSVLIISHNPSILSYIQPDRVHVVESGRIVKTGGKELISQIVRSGYE